MRHFGKMQAVVGLAVIAAFFAACYAVWFQPMVEGGARDVALILVGSLASSFVTVVQWHYGSSSGSARKDVARDAALINKQEKIDVDA